MPPEPSPSPPPAVLLRQTALAAAAIAALALVYLHPIATRFGSHLAPDPGDPLFNLYLLKWGVHQLRLGFPDFWNAPFFHPAQGVTALSDHLLGPALFTAVLTALGAGYVAAYNTLFFASFVLCGAATFWVLRRSGVGPWGAWLGAAAFAFSPFRWEQTSHIQMLLAGWIPLVLWTWDRLLAGPAWRRAGLFLAVYLVHLSGGLYLAYMVHVPLAVLLLNRLRELRAHLREPAARRVLVATALVAAAAVAAVFVPYLQADRLFGIERPPGVAQTFGATSLSYLNPSWWNLYAGLWPGPLWRPENSLFAGVLPTALALAGLLGLVRRPGASAEVPPAPEERRRRRILACLLAAAALGLVLGDLYTWSERGRFPDLARWVPGRYEAAALLLAGGLGGWFLLWRRWHGEWAFARLPQGWTRGLLLAALACLALTLAPVYRAAWEVLPGLSGMRVPTRFYPFVSLALALLAGLGLDRLLERLRSPASRRAAGLLAAALLAVDLAPRPLPWIPIPAEAELAPVHAWIAGRPEVRALLVLPWDGMPIPQLLEIRAMYEGSRHWKPLVNGYSGHFPPFHQRLHTLCCGAVPEAPALAELRRAGVTHVLVHLGDLRKRWQRKRVRGWPRSGEVVTVYDDGNDMVFRLLPAPAKKPR